MPMAEFVGGPLDGDFREVPDALVTFQVAMSDTPVCACGRSDQHMAGPSCGLAATKLRTGVYRRTISGEFRWRGEEDPASTS